MLYDISTTILKTNTIEGVNNPFYEKIKKKHSYCMYLTNIDTDDVEFIELFFNDIKVLSISKEILLNNNKKYYNIELNKIIIILNRNILDFNTNTINFFYIDLKINIKTKNNEKQPYTLNILTSDILCFRDGMSAIIPHYN